MGKVIIQEETTKNPVTLIGKEAGICWNANTEDEEKNYNRGIDCLKSGHGRTWEYPQVYMVLDGYSARVIRELYTHIGGSPTRLQASTRYIDYENGFGYVVPESIKKDKYAYIKYIKTMAYIVNNMRDLNNLGVPREDSALLLPLGMETKVVVRTNLRNLVDMSHQRMCKRAYWEFRKMFNDICAELSKISYEWKYIVDNYMKPKCKVYGHCSEKNSCKFKKSEDK